MQSEAQQNEFLFRTEEKTIRHAEEILYTNDIDKTQLVQEYKQLLKGYKKVFIHLKKLITMTDRQQKKVNRLNSELIQTNSLLAEVSGKESLRISRENIKQLSTITNYLVLTKNQLLSYNQTDSHHTDYLDHLQNLNIVTSNLQDCIMQTKLQPLSIVYANLPKIISQSTKNNLKEIQLNLKGKNVRVDNDFLNALSFILSHLVENVCIHGIESRKEREKLSKSPVGTIDISAVKKDQHIIIEVKDDGRGVNFQPLDDNQHSSKNSAPIELKQWIDHLKLSHKDIHQNSGLTKIHEQIDTIKGTIHIHQQTKGQGLRYILKLPESIAIFSGLIIEVAGNRFIIPQNSIVELISVYDMDIFTTIEYTPEHEVIRLREKLVPLIRLNEVLSTPNQFNSEKRLQIVEKYSRIRYENEQDQDLDEVLLFAVLKAETGRFALVIDQIIGNEEIVYMPLHPLIKHLSIYSGISILGDGCVSMILNPEGIFRHVDVQIDDSDKNQSLVEQNSNIKRILIFKSGRKEQFAVLLSEIYRLVRVNVKDIQYKSDAPLLAIDGVITQVIILDHFISVSALQSSDILYLLILKNMDQPSGILMSRLDGIHRVALAIERDTIIEEGILGTMKINEQLTIFLDVSTLAKMARMAYQ